MLGQNGCSADQVGLVSARTAATGASSELDRATARQVNDFIASNLRDSPAIGPSSSLART